MLHEKSYGTALKYHTILQRELTEVMTFDKQIGMQTLYKGTSEKYL